MNFCSLLCADYTAYFGYDNMNSHNVHLSVSVNNHFQLNGVRDDSFESLTLFRSGQYNYLIAA